MPRERTQRSRRRSSSSSSVSTYDRKRSKKKSKKRSRSRERSYSKSPTKSRKSRRSYSRSKSRDRYSSRSKRSSSRSRYKKSSRRSPSYEKSRRSSRERRHSRSSSRDYRRSSHRKSKRRSSDSASSKSTTPEKKIPVKKEYIIEEPTEKKLEKAIKAAEAAGLTMTKIQTFDLNDVEIKEDMPTIHDRNLLNDLNSDSFVQKQFKSSRSKKMSENIIINLDDNTIKVPEIEKIIKEDELLDLSTFPCEEDAKEIWIRKLYQYRKKMIKGEI